MGIKEKIVKKVLGEESEEKKVRSPEITEVERLQKEFAGHVEIGCERLSTALDMMADRGLPPEVAEYVGEAYGKMETLKQLNKDLLAQYREDTETVHKSLREMAKEQETKKANTEAVLKIKKKYVGVKG